MKLSKEAAGALKRTAEAMNMPAEELLERIILERLVPRPGESTGEWIAGLRSGAVNPCAHAQMMGYFYAHSPSLALYLAEMLAAPCDCEFCQQRREFAKIVPKIPVEVRAEE